MFIHPSYTLCHPLEPTLYHPHPPTHLFPLSYTNYPLPAESRFTIIHPHSLSIWVPLRPAPRADSNVVVVVVVLGVMKPQPCSSALSFHKCMKPARTHPGDGRNPGTQRNGSRIMLKLRSAAISCCMRAGYLPR